MRVALLCGITLAIANFIKMTLIDRVALEINLVVNLTLVCTIFIAKLIGCSLPLIAKKLGFDPAVMVNPFITTLVDACSLMIYFQVATHILNLAI